MIEWTTPTITCTIPEVECDYILLTLKQGSTIIEKRIEASEISNNQFSATFTQAETGQFEKTNLYSTIEAQLNIIKGSTRMATNIVQLSLTKNLHNEAI